MKVKYFEIDAFYPFYTEDGHDHTCILLKDGSKEYVSQCVKHFIPHLLYDTGLDARSIRLWASKVTGLKQNLPIIIDENIIFIPVKFRKRLNSTTRAFGYINYNSIKKKMFKKKWFWNFPGGAIVKTGEAGGILKGKEGKFIFANPSTQKVTFFFFC